ncbi:MAG: hypothetical protein AAF957_10330 [Planctomycetota bacterium]
MLARLLIAASALVAPATAQDLLVTDTSTGLVMRFDGATGALLDPAAFDLTSLSQGAVTRPSEVLFAPNGELWVVDSGSDDLHRFAGDGSSYIGAFGLPAVNLIGGATFGEQTVIGNSEFESNMSFSTLVELDGDGALTGTVATQLPLDVEPFERNGVEGFLVSDNLNSQILFADANDLSSQVPVTPLPNLTRAPLALQMRRTPSGSFLLCTLEIFGSRVTEYDASGQVVTSVDVLALGATASGVAPLENGNLLVSGPTGVHVVDPVAGTLTTVLADVDGLYVSEPTTGSGYCTGVPNSTGVPAATSAVGSRAVADDEMTLHCHRMPTGATAYFLASRQPGLTTNPGGSDGNLCLAGPIGRFVGPGQVLNSGAEGRVSLDLDLAAHPTPTGFVQVLPGETWFYQCWYRDSTGGQATSNFSNGWGITFR